MLRRNLLAIFLAVICLGACVRRPQSPNEAGPRSTAPDSANPALTEAPSATAVVTPQPTAAPVVYGPDAEQFPAGINPLTGLPEADPELLKIPAVLVSISHFPPSGRPQAGLSFAPFVYEFSITAGETRFLAAFHGRFPEAQLPLSGECSVRTGAFAATSEVLGNRVWLDF